MKIHSESFVKTNPIEDAIDFLLEKKETVCYANEAKRNQVVVCVAVTGTCLPRAHFQCASHCSYFQHVRYVGSTDSVMGAKGRTCLSLAIRT